MNRLQAVVLVVGTGIAWIGYSLGFAALGIPQAIESRVIGTPPTITVQAQSPTRSTGHNASIQPVVRTNEPKPTVVIPTATFAPTATAPPVPTKVSTPTPAPTITPTPTPYVVREYTEQLPNGDIRAVRQWSDGRYEEIERYEPSSPPEPAPSPSVIPTADPVYPCLSDFFRKRPGEKIEIRINQKTAIAGGPLLINPSSGTTASYHSLTARLSLCDKDKGKTIILTAWQPIFLGDSVPTQYGPELLRNMNPGGGMPSDRKLYLSQPWPVNAQRVLSTYPYKNNGITWQVEPGYYLLGITYKDIVGRVIVPEVIFRMDVR